MQGLHRMCLSVVLNLPKGTHLLLDPLPWPIGKNWRRIKQNHYMVLKTPFEVLQKIIHEELYSCIRLHTQSCVSILKCENTTKVCLLNCHLKITGIPLRLTDTERIELFGSTPSNTFKNLYVKKIKHQNC